MYRLKKILVPTDFSTESRAALEHAVRLATKYEAEITLMHVDEFVVSPLGALGVKADYLDVYQRNKMEFLKEELEKLRRGIGGKCIVQTCVVSGRAYKVIVEESEVRGFDLIVIAARGLTALSEHLIGSTAERVVRLSRQPVLSVRSAPQLDRIESILCPTDLSPTANIALSYALSIALQNNSVLYIQYISELDKPEPESEIRKRLPALEQHHRDAKDVKVHYVFDRDIEPSNSIIRFAEDREISLIVMSTHGRKGLRRVHIGNNAAEVVRQSTRPVLSMTHPLHKTVFTHPLTERRPSTIPGRKGS